MQNHSILYHILLSYLIFFYCIILSYLFLSYSKPFFPLLKYTILNFNLLFYPLLSFAILSFSPLYPKLSTYERFVCWHNRKWRFHFNFLSLSLSCSTMFASLIWYEIIPEEKRVIEIEERVEEKSIEATAYKF